MPAPFSTGRGGPRKSWVSVLESESLGNLARIGVHGGQGYEPTARGSSAWGAISSTCCDLGEGGIELDLFGDFTLSAEFRIDWDNEPAENAKKTDTRYMLKIGYAFEGDEDDWWK